MPWRRSQQSAACSCTRTGSTSASSCTRPTWCVRPPRVQQGVCSLQSMHLLCDVFAGPLLVMLCASAAAAYSRKVLSVCCAGAARHHAGRAQWVRQDLDHGGAGGCADRAGHQARDLAHEPQGDHSAPDVWPHGPGNQRLDGRHLRGAVAQVQAGVLACMLACRQRPAVHMLCRPRCLSLWFGTPTSACNMPGCCAVQGCQEQKPEHLDCAGWPCGRHLD